MKPKVLVCNKMTESVLFNPEFADVNELKRINIGDVIKYNDGYNPYEVTQLALKRGYTVEYCEPGTPEYKEHGCQTMKVTGLPTHRQEKQLGRIDLRVDLPSAFEIWRRSRPSYNGSGKHTVPACTLSDAQIMEIIDLVIEDYPIKPVYAFQDLNGNITHESQTVSAVIAYLAGERKNIMEHYDSVDTARIEQLVFDMHLVKPSERKRFDSTKFLKY